MLGRTPNLHFVVRTAIIVGIAASAALANGSIRQVVDIQPRLCYCQCAQETGAKHCTKMCMLPQYQDRWWATSCQKKHLPSLKSQPQIPNTHTRKTNYIEDARREE
jgi:hypothetical protein